MAVARASKIRHLKFIEIPFREKAAARAARTNAANNQCGVAV
jgi:hypothetical protein